MRRKQAGEILIGMAIAVVMIGMVLSYFGVRQVNEWRVSRGEIVGGALAELGKGVNSYVVQYHPQIVSALFGGPSQVKDAGGRVIVQNAAAPTAAEIASIAGLSGFGATPPIPGGNYVIRLSRGGSCVDQATCNVNALTYIDRPLLMPFPGASDRVDYMATGAAVQAIGINGGASFLSPSNANSNANLTFHSPGGAVEAIPNPVAGAPGGIVAMRGGYIRADFDEFLRRDGTKPMTGNLNMDAHDILNAKDILGSGTITMGGDVKAGASVFANMNVSAGRDVAAGGKVTAGQNVEAGQDVVAAHDVRASNDVKAAQNVVAGNMVQGNTLYPNKVVAENEPGCSPEGAIARSSAGLILSCQSGRWVSGTKAISGMLCGIHIVGD
ncbi:hypothetical protein, partial [Chromobacterium phragmitis]|uniref:hypothetical protein n=1 Tax=Chromobacterium phragmitis TaxID=2202141 RepID=UPI00326495AD